MNLCIFLTSASCLFSDWHHSITIETEVAEAFVKSPMLWLYMMLHLQVLECYMDVALKANHESWRWKIGIRNLNGRTTIDALQMKLILQFCWLLLTNTNHMACQTKLPPALDDCMLRTICRVTLTIHFCFWIDGQRQRRSHIFPQKYFSTDMMEKNLTFW